MKNTISGQTRGKRKMHERDIRGSEDLISGEKLQYVT